MSPDFVVVEKTKIFEHCPEKLKKKKAQLISKRN